MRLPTSFYLFALLPEPLHTHQRNAPRVAVPRNKRCVSCGLLAFSLEAVYETRDEKDGMNSEALKDSITRGPRDHCDLVPALFRLDFEQSSLRLCGNH